MSKGKNYKAKKQIKFNIDGMRGFAARCHLFLLCHEIYKNSAICLVIFSIDIICEAVVYLHIYYTFFAFFSIFGALWCKAEFFFLPHFFFSCWRVVISLLIEIKPNYLMWSWYWFDFRNQDIFLNWILEALSLGTKAEAPTVLPCSTVASMTKESLIMGVYIDKKFDLRENPPNLLL